MMGADRKKLKYSKMDEFLLSQLFEPQSFVKNKQEKWREILSKYSSV